MASAGGTQSCNMEEAGPDDECASVSDSQNSGNSEEEESPYRDPPIGQVRLRPSSLSLLPPTVFFDYPPELGLQRQDRFDLRPLENLKMEFMSHWERVCVRNAFRRAGFQKSSRNWTVMWSKHPSQTQMDSLNELQKVNHFPGSWCIGRKDRLSRTLTAMKRQHGHEYDFHPQTYVMPYDREAFLRVLRTDAGSNSKKDPLWIVKPCASSCGRGISVKTSADAGVAARKKRVLIQRYVQNPLLIDGKKFDLRIYVLVTGVDPLRVYIHEEGLTRISTAPYATSGVKNRFAHLTNYSINKKSNEYRAAGDCANSNDSNNDMDGFKWSLSAFKKWMIVNHGKLKMDVLFSAIKDICVKTMIAAESEITPHLHRSTNYRTNCFELFGLDIMIDDNLSPSLLEVNVSPSLMGSSSLDRQIKGKLIADVFHTVGIYCHDSSLIEHYRQSETRRKEKNPFGFCNWTQLLSTQDSYRRCPTSASIDLSRLNSADPPSEKDWCAWWQLLIMVEDEISRSQSGGFELLHPVATSASKYCSLARVPRFSDHLLAKWVEIGGSSGEGGEFLPHNVRSLLRGDRRFSRVKKEAECNTPMSGLSNDLDGPIIHCPTTQAKPKDWILFQRINRNVANVPAPNPPRQELTKHTHVRRPESSHKVVTRPLTAKKNLP